jgi:hypothetical protein
MYYLFIESPTSNAPSSNRPTRVPLKCRRSESAPNASLSSSRAPARPSVRRRVLLLPVLVPCAEIRHLDHLQPHLLLPSVPSLALLYEASMGVCSIDSLVHH